MENQVLTGGQILQHFAAEYDKKYDLESLFLYSLLNDAIAEYIADRINAIASNSNEFEGFKIIFCELDDESYDDAHVSKFCACYDDDGNQLVTEEEYPNDLVLALKVQSFFDNHPEALRVTLDHFIRNLVIILQDSGIIEDYYIEEDLEAEESNDNFNCYRTFRFYLGKG